MFHSIGYAETYKKQFWLKLKKVPTELTNESMILFN